MSTTKTLDYVVEWHGDGAAGGQVVPLAYTPRSVQAYGVDAGSSLGVQFSAINGGPTLELPAGLPSSAITPAAAGGFKADGNANLAGWTYRAVCLA